ncbi:MAG: Na/Pi cotransporter family protein [Clostridiaceae bacterium]
MRDFIFGIVGGTAMLMYGVDMMGEGLERLSGNMMKKVLQKLTGKLWKAFFVGIFLTALVQSSTAISILSVGFVNSGILELSQAIGIIYGANIGTTITAQLFALSFSFKLTTIALPIIAIGFSLKVFAKKIRFQNVGHSIMGIGFMLYGLTLLNSGIPYMEQNETIRYFFETYASNMFIGILLGIVTTALVHSSAATVGIVMLLGNSGLITLTSAIAIMFGDNIGTSISALLASFKGNTNAKRTAWGHALHNIIGVLIFLPFVPWFTQFITFFTNRLQGSTDIQLQIANSHTLFNIMVALIFLPLNNYFVKLLKFIVKDKKTEGEFEVIYIDNLLLDTPAAALEASIKEIKRAMQTNTDMLGLSIASVIQNNVNNQGLIMKREEFICKLQKDLTNYMVELSRRPLSISDSVVLPGIIKCANYLERIADHTTILMKLQETRFNKELYFTPAALKEIDELHRELSEMSKMTSDNINEFDEEVHAKVKEAEARIDFLTARFTGEHVKRLENGECTIEGSLVYLNMITAMERISNYLYKISRLCRYELQGKSSPTA